MEFPNSYIALDHNKFCQGDYSITPIRYKDRFDIMKWRNEQMYHLRQKEVLTEEIQENYFTNIVSKLFLEKEPSQLLFSYLKEDKCIGYGGLVHINWEKKTAEVSFIMDTSLEVNEFELHWTNYLYLLKKIGFEELKFDSIFTYAYNLRPHLYPVLEKNEFKLKSLLKDEIEIEQAKVDVLIHECKSPTRLLNIRESSLEDLELIYKWSNDLLVRSQSFNSEHIEFEDHKKWFEKKLTNYNSLLLINEYEGVSAGLVRFEIEKEICTIGVLLDENYRGKGLSSLMLIKSSTYYFKKFNQPILASIKESNKASIRAFEKAGYVFFKKDVVNGFPTFIYKLEKK